MKSKKFKLPQSPPGTGLDDKKVLVISFFGKSPHNAAGCKTGLLDGFLGRTVFQSSMLDDPCIEDEEALCDIEGFYDENQKIIVLHLRGVFDTHSLVKIYKQFEGRLEEDGYLTVWSELNSRYARALLLLFSISHILVLSQPSHTFDLGYLSLFRSLDNIRQKLQPEVVELLSSLPRLPKEWAANGRPCSPRVLFCFETCPALYRHGNSGKSVGTFTSTGLHGWSGEDELVRPPTVAGDNRGKPSIKRLEHALEDQIYHILRKSRVIANVSTNSLFAIPANQEFVFVNCAGTDAARGRLHFLAHSLVELCNRSAVGAVNRQEAEPFPAAPTLAPGNEHSFRALLQQHVDQAFGKGFDDNVGRNAPPSYFEMASASVWHSVAAALYDAFVGPSSWETVASSVTALLGTDVRFSEARCGKVLPIATATYQDNLPPHYTRDYHQTRLSRALAVLAAHARGPLYAATCARLASECMRWWRQGRQVCEVLSLTGHACTAPLHRGGGAGAGGGQLQLEPGIDATALPCRGHSSGMRYTAACNCGRAHGVREDPFSARTANHEFYQRLAEECGCGALEAFRFPVFTPSTQDYKAAQLFNARPSVKSAPLEVEGPVCEAHSFSLAGFVSVASACSDLLAEDEPSRTSPHPVSTHASDWPASSALASDWTANATHTSDWAAGSTLPTDWPGEGHDIVIQVSDHAEAEHSKEKGLVRQPSTTEYLPGMLHTESPSGLLPRFPSWALTCLGASSLYSHNLGLQDQPNLLPGSAFLLPWDVAVRLHGHRERCWPAVGDGPSFGGRGKSYLSASQAAVRGRKPKPLAKDASEFVVKLFIGVEYECPRGHRFMCSGPDKVLKASGAGLVKDTGNRVAANDMPLYCACPCRSAKPLVAQLMRVHVVTPKAPVCVTLAPRVQPAPAPCAVFVPGADKPLRLSQSSYWVLRLPFVYVGDHGPHVAPKDPVSPGFGRLLAGMFSISEQPLQE